MDWGEARKPGRECRVERDVLKTSPPCAVENVTPMRGFQTPLTSIFTSKESRQVGSLLRQGYLEEGRLDVLLGDDLLEFLDYFGVF